MQLLYNVLQNYRSNFRARSNNWYLGDISRSQYRSQKFSLSESSLNRLYNSLFAPQIFINSFEADWLTEGYTNATYNVYNYWYVYVEYYKADFKSVLTNRLNLVPDGRLGASRNIYVLVTDDWEIDRTHPFYRFGDDSLVCYATPDCNGITFVINGTKELSNDKMYYLIESALRMYADRWGIKTSDFHYNEIEEMYACRVPDDSYLYAKINTWKEWAEGLIRYYESIRGIKEKERALANLDKLATTSIFKDVQKLRRQYQEYSDKIKRYQQDIANYIVQMEQVSAELSYSSQAGTYEPLANALRNLVQAGRLTNIDKFDVSSNGKFSMFFTMIGTTCIWEEDEVAQALKHVKHEYSAPVYYNVFKALMDRKYIYHYEQGLYMTNTTVQRADSSSASRGCSPHIGFYNCWGNNESSLTAALVGRDYDIALAIMDNALSQINLTDYCVLERWVSCLADNWKSDYVCIERASDGEMISLGKFREEVNNA